jgi:hypothetical protein
VAVIGATRLVADPIAHPAAQAAAFKRELHNRFSRKPLLRLR